MGSEGKERKQRINQEDYAAGKGKHYETWTSGETVKIKILRV